jgi:hypothetical protein
MATGMSAAAANGAVDTWLGAYTWVKLYVGDPGASGASNAATETTRKQATWAASSGGASSNTGALTWTAVAGTEDFTHFGIWTASTAGTFGGSGTITANAVVAGDTFTIAIGDLDIALAPVAA